MLRHTQLLMLQMEFAATKAIGKSITNVAPKSALAK